MKPLLIFLSMFTLSTSWAHEEVQQKNCEAFCIPSFELKGALAKIFSISGCEFISGLTCKISYSGAAPLPSEVFFTEIDEHGKQAGARVRLIYPELKKGETGAATFRIRTSNPVKIILEGEWKGPYRDPH